MDGRKHLSSCCWAEVFCLGLEAAVQFLDRQCFNRAKNFSVPITTKDKITGKRFIWEIKGVLIFFLNRKVPKESLGRLQILLLLMHALIHPTFMLIANGHLQRAYRPIGLWHLVHYKLILFIKKWFIHNKSLNYYTYKHLYKVIVVSTSVFMVSSK